MKHLLIIENSYLRFSKNSKMAHLKTKNHLTWLLEKVMQILITF